MNILIRTPIPLMNILKCLVSNVSPKRFHYTFETGSAQKNHPMRQLSMGTDRLLISNNLLAITDHGISSKGYSQNEEDSYSQKLLKVMHSFFNNEMEKYIRNPYQLVSSAVSSIKLEGNCTLTLAILHPETGELALYYIGDSLYAIFQEKQVVLIEPLYYSFNEPYRVGSDGQDASRGYLERYPYSEVKNQIIALGSNGLWNNVDLQLLHYQIRGPHSFRLRRQEPNSQRFSFSDPKSLQQISERICNMAAYYSRKGKFESPFYKLARKHGVQVPKEGYLDDASVILARIKAQVVIK